MCRITRLKDMTSIVADFIPCSASLEGYLVVETGKTQARETLRKKSIVNLKPKMSVFAAWSTKELIWS